MSEKLKILFIEDSADDVELLLLELNKGGIEVEWERVDTADALTKALAKKEWDLIISDYAMPGFTGVDALKIVRERDQLTPFIIVSGTIGEDIAVQAMKNGANDFIMKDKLARLVPAIKRELKEAQVRKKAGETEDALKREREKAHTYFQVAGSIIIVVNRKQELELINKKGCELLGYKEDEIIGKNWFDKCRWEADLEKVKDHFDELLEGKVPLVEKFENQVITKTKEKRMISWTSHLLYDDDGKLKGTLNAGVDITEKKEFQEALMESEEKYRSLFDDALDMIHIADSEGIITEANEMQLSALGYTREEFIGMSLMELIHPDYQEMAGKALGGVLQGEAISGIEAVMMTKKGEEIWVEVNVSPEIIDGKIVSARAILRDITERKNAEEVLKERNKELNTFIYKSSHDLRAPLASILGLINVSQMEVKDTEASKYFDLIKDRILTQDKILAELLRVSGIHKGKIRPEMIDPVEEVKEIVKSLETSEAAGNIKFTLKDRYKKKIKTDRMLFVSIVQNIVSNAIVYKNAAIRKPHVHLELAVNGKGIDISIKDNGIGIPKDIQPHIYNMFYRGHEDSKGSGLGLYLVAKSLDKLGGTVCLNSEKGKGSTFSVFLPDMKGN